MSALAAPPRGPRRVALLGLGAGAAALTAGAWLIGLDLAAAVSIGLFAAALYALRWLTGGDTDAWIPEVETSHITGTRRDVARLSWGLHGRDARVDRWSATRLHTLAAHRLADRGLDLDDPDDADACRAVLGGRTYDALTLDPNRLPRLPEFVAALDVVERLTPEETSR